MKAIAAVLTSPRVLPAPHLAGMKRVVLGLDRLARADIVERRGVGRVALCLRDDPAATSSVAVCRQIGLSRGYLTRHRDAIRTHY